MANLELTSGIIYPSQQVVFQNTLASITCFSKVDPEINIPRWYRNKKYLPAFNLMKTIILINVKVNDSGTYRCVGLDPSTDTSIVLESNLIVAAGKNVK